MKLDTLFENFDLLMDASNAVPKMLDLILQLAVQGELVEQDHSDEPAGELLKRIKAEKEKLIAEGKIKNQKSLPPINKDEIPYGIPESWTWIRLEEVFYPISVGKKKIKTSEMSEEGPCPVIDQGQSYIAGYTNEADKLINIPGPVIIFGDHTCELKLINFDFVAGADGVKVLRPVEIYENYFFLVLKTFKMEDRGYSRHYKYFLNNLLPLPSLTEQKRIVTKVDQLMQLCDQLDACQKKTATKYESLNDAALERLLSAKNIEEFAEHWQFLCNNFELIYNDSAHINKLRQAILQLAVQGKLAPQDPNDEPASELLKRIKAEKEKLITEGKIKKQKPLLPITEDEIPYELPQGWEWMRLGEIGLLQRGKSKHRPRNDPKLFKNGKYCFVQTGDVSNAKNNQGLITICTSKYNEIGLSQSRMWPKGTLCITIAANIAETGFLNFDACFPDSVVGFTSLTGETTSQYTYYFLNVSKTKLEDYAPSTAQKNINLGILDKLVFPLPPLAEQKRIVAKVDQLMHLCDELGTRLNQSKKDSEMLMQAVLQEAFS